jgi:hypothetical protein
MTLSDALAWADSHGHPEQHHGRSGDPCGRGGGACDVTRVLLVDDDADADARASLSAALAAPS